MRYTLRCLFAASLISSALPEVSAQNVGISPTAAVPNVRALLDIDVTGLPAGGKRGMLIPRMTAAERTAIAGLNAANDKGLWVYQTDDGTNALTAADPTLLPKYAKGFYYYEGILPAPDDWVRWSTGGSSWRTNGNANTLPATNYLGTSGVGDDLHIRTTNTGAQPQLLIASTSATTGYVGVNPIGAPVERLDVNGAVRVGNTALNTAGAIKFDNTATSPNRWHYGNLNGTPAGWQRLENAEVEYTNQAYRPFALQCLGAAGQTIRGTLGSVTDGVGPGQNPNTPFNTNTGFNLRQGHHVQYIYPASELTAAGLCAGPITAISMYVLGTDPSGSPGPDMRIEIRMRHTGLTTFAANNWEPTALWGPGNYTPLNTDSLISYLAQPGWKQWNFIPGGFNWDGVQNVVVDLAWFKSPTIGTSPKVNLEVGLPYQATKWVTWTVGNDPTGRHGRTYRDNPLSPGANVGTTNNRPVTRFNGNIQTFGYTAADAFDSFIGYNGGIMVDDGTGAPGVWADANFRGPGTVRAQTAVYDGNLQLSDHVFDRYFDGEVRPEESSTTTGYAYIGVDQLKDYLAKERHLPSMPSRAEWESQGSGSLGELQTGLWETVETQSLHIIELEKDLRAMEALAFGKAEDPERIQELIDEVNASRRLTDAQKLHLTTALRQRASTPASTK